VLTVADDSLPSLVHHQPKTFVDYVSTAPCVPHAELGPTTTPAAACVPAWHDPRAGGAPQAAPRLGRRHAQSVEEGSARVLGHPPAIIARMHGMGRHARTQTPFLR
jgi:hypothetical protein